MYTITAADIAAPPVNRDMKTLDRSFFTKTVRTSALSVPNAKDIQKVKSKLLASHDLLATTTIRPIINDEVKPGQKAVLMRPRVRSDDSSTWQDSWKGLLEDGTASIRPYDLTLKYDHWAMSDILDAILPEIVSKNPQEDHPAGFAQVGHIAHLNLKEVYLPYKHLIGQVLLDKNSGVRTVINKLNDVGHNSIFRTFPYEVLAGENDLEVTVSHLGCQFKFNYAKVYWNIRNSHEHERLLSSFREGEALCDVTAGVGPFAVPAAKKGVWVWANDLNPACYDALSAAVKTNKMNSFVKTFNGDGATFIRDAAKSLLKEQRSFVKRPRVNTSRAVSEAEKEKVKALIERDSVRIFEPATFDHFVMNLPETGIDFLHAFKGLYDGHEDIFTGPKARPIPKIHVYTFQQRKATIEEEHEEILQRLSEKLGYQLSSQEHEVELHQARLVAPKKWYYCASFRLPKEVAFA